MLIVVSWHLSARLIPTNEQGFPFTDPPNIETRWGEEEVYSWLLSDARWGSREAGTSGRFTNVHPLRGKWNLDRLAQVRLSCKSSSFSPKAKYYDEVFVFMCIFLPVTY